MSRSRSTRARVQVWATVLAAGAAVATVQCGADNTGHLRTTFAVRARGVRADATTSAGWTLHVEQAFVAAGPVRWYEGEPLFGWNAPWRALRVGVAEAHPGHYVAGEALADTTSQRVIDLLAARGVDLEPATGVTGDANSAALELRAPGATLGPAGAALHAQTLWMRGTATRGGTTVRFEGGALLDRAVTGIPAHGEITAAPGSWDLAVDLGAWLDRADFATLPPPPTPDGYAAIPGDGQVANALFRGATSAGSYRFTSAAGARDR